MERQLAAILAADVVGYSKLMGADQDATLMALRQLRGGLLASSVSEHGGEIVKSMGDGWFISFASVTSAVQCAIDIQNGLSETSDLELRIGVHIGDIVREDEDLFGDGVNIAARLQAAAAPGDVVISDTVHHSLDGQLGGAFHTKPPLKLKNIARPMTVFSWSDAPVQGEEISRTGEDAPSEQKKIYLGFCGLSLKAGDDDASLLCDSVNEAIQAALSNQAGFTLLTDPDKADMLVEGSIHARGSRYRAIVQLVDRQNNKLVKAEKFDGVIADLFESEDELALRICTSLRFAAFAYEASALKKTDIPMAEQASGAIRAHVGGLLSDLHYEEWLEARQLLDIVLDRDPDDASALAMSGMACLIEPICGWRAPAQGDCDLALEHLRRGTRLNPNSDFGHTILSIALLELAGDHVGALFTAEQLSKIAPHYAQGQMAQAAALVYGGQVTEGLDIALRAIEPLKTQRLFSYNAAYLMLGLLLDKRHDEVLVWGQMVNQRIENVPRNLLLMTSAAAHMNDLELAKDYAATLLENHPDFTLDKMRVWPLKRTEDWTHFYDGLRTAGLPG